MMPKDKEVLRKKLVNILALRAEAKGISFGQALLEMKKEIDQLQKNPPKSHQNQK